MTVMLDTQPTRVDQTATYRGILKPPAVVGLVVGPNTLGEYLTATTAELIDDGTEEYRTRVGFAYGAYIHLEHRDTAFGTLYRGNPSRPWKATPR